MNTIINKINKLKKEKNAIILGHFYESPEVQEISDFIGDSLALAQKAQKTDADIIVFAGVLFMAETAKILYPDKKVLLPDLNAGCSLADSCEENKFKKFLMLHPDRYVISYVNTSAKIKALSDCICTSSNAIKIVKSVPIDKKIIFGPDKNLGTYVKKSTNRDILLWDGACHVHKRFSAEKIKQLKKKYPNAKIISHPECEASVLEISDFIDSTSGLLKYTNRVEYNEFIIATEPGIIYQMQKANPEKLYIAAPSFEEENNICEYMKMCTLTNIYNSLKEEKFEINLEENLINKARGSILKMLEISNKLKL
ncbi:MAG: quinolinate synthase NadA [Bacteroidetes bacterium]|nr:quinolinate synthase NadA [Bacteroidota bacterium]